MFWHCLPTSLVTEVSNRCFIASAHAHNALISNDLGRQDELCSFVSHYVALDMLEGSVCSLTDMVSMKSHCADSPRPANPTSPATACSFEIPLYKRDLWQHLQQVKAMSFKTVDRRQKRKTAFEDLISGVGSLNIGSSLAQSMKKLKISQEDPSTDHAPPVVATHVPLSYLNSGKETALKDFSTKPATLQVPGAPKAVSSIQEDSLAPTFTGFLK